MEQYTIISAGKTAEVYDYAPGKVVKLYFPPFGKEAVDHEINQLRSAVEAGVPAPRALEYIEIAGRAGLILEKANGHSLITHLERTPWKVRQIGRIMAQTHARIHACTSISFPEQPTLFIDKISVADELSAGTKERLYTAVFALPAGSSVCHGDFHPGNMLYSAPHSRVIDWGTAYCGCPEGDVVRTCLGLLCPDPVRDHSPFLRMFLQPMKRLLLSAYLGEYLRITGMPRQHLQRWVVPVAAARLHERSTADNAWLLKLINGDISVRF